MSKEANIELHKKIHSFITTALLAVEITRINGDISEGEFSSSMFLSRWIKKAIKQKRFHRDLIDVLNTFVGKKAKPSHIQKLKSDFTLILSEYRTVRLKDEVFQQSEVSRLNTALELIAASGMKVQVPLDYDPVTNGPYEHQTNNELFILENDYKFSVDDDNLKSYLNIYMVGDRQTVIDFFYLNGFISELANKSVLNNCHYSHYSHLRIHPKNDVSESIAIPTMLL